MAKKTITKKRIIVITCVLCVVIAICIALAAVAPVLMLNNYDAVLRQYFGEGETPVAGEGYEDITDGFDTQYYTSNYDSEDEIRVAARKYFREAAAEGYVLLENDEDDGLPIATSSSSKTQLDLYSQSSVDFVIGGTGSGTSAADWTLKDAFEDVGYTVNSALWNYYSSSGVSRGEGAKNYGTDETWEINEVPLATLESKVDSVANIAKQGGVAVFIMSRTGGEGRDEARSMASYTNSYNVDADADKAKNYLEPNSTELQIIDELNKQYDRVILVINTNNVMETGWVKDYSNIKSVIWVPGGGDQAVYALADIFCGNTTPSGHLADTMAYDNFSSPAMVNFGDIAYTSGGYGADKETGYYGLSYDEGIYVGYKYYETRYYDSIVNPKDSQATTKVNTAIYTSTGDNWDYDNEVAYTFGYGKSYTTFEWGTPTVTLSNESGNVTKDDTITISVEVTNTGNYDGKDVVQVYASVPYTEFDKTNYIEKSAVTLVGYAKTGTLTKNGGKETVSITVNVSDLISYDDVVNKTYILEGGNYYITCATDAHDAVQNVIAAQVKDKSIDVSVFSEGNADLVYTYVPTISDSQTSETDNGVKIDATTFSTSAVGTEITNQFGDTTDSSGNFIANADEGGTNLTARDKYLTRQAWSDSWPDNGASQDSKVASGYSEINGYTWERQISDKVLAKLQSQGDAEAANNPEDGSSVYAPKVSDLKSDEVGTFGESGQDYIVKYRGYDFGTNLENIDLTAMFKTLSLISQSDVQMLLGAAGYSSTDVDAIAKPRILDRDGPAGLNEMTTGKYLSIAYPAEVCIAATFNTEVASAHGYFTGNDALQNGVAAWYGPAMDIHRSPFSGRNFEYYSEDTYLSGSMASATVYQAAKLGLSAYVKHFVMNDQENHRCDNGLATWANEQTMREQYFKVFQMVSEAPKVTVKYYALDSDGNYAKEADGTYKIDEYVTSPMRAVMSSFNRIGATWAGGDYRLITKVLRQEWGFQGVVLTDFAQDAGFGYQRLSQEIRAGASNMLLNYGTGSFVTFNTVDDIYYEKIALTNFMYTVVNSSAMNGYLIGVGNPGLPFAYYYWILAALEVVAAAGFVISVVFMVIKWRSYLQQKNA